MIRQVLHAILLLASLPAVAAPSAALKRDIRISVSAGYPASLYYVVDQLSQWETHHAESYYRAFWLRRFGLNAEDERQLRVYAALRKRYALSLSPEEKSESPLATAGDGRNLSGKWPLMFCESRELPEVWSKARYWLMEPDLRDLRAVLLRFDAKFRGVWDADSAYLNQAVAAFKSGGWEEKLAAYLDRVADFFSLDPAYEKSFTVSFLWQPEHEFSQGHSAAHHEEDLMVVQLPRDQDGGTDDQLDVVVHEIIHDLFQTRKRQAQAALDAAMIGEDAAFGLLAAQGLNEGLATALGNALFEEQHRPESFKAKSSWYSDPAVDGYAHAVYATVRAAMERGEALDRLAARLVGDLRRAQRAPLALAPLFRSVILLTDAQTKSAIDPLKRSLSLASLWRYNSEEHLGDFQSLLKEHWAMPVIIMVEPGRMESLRGAMDWSLTEAELAELKGKAEKYPLAYFTRSVRGRLYLLVMGPGGALPKSLPALKRAALPKVSTVITLAE